MFSLKRKPPTPVHPAVAYNQAIRKMSTKLLVWAVDYRVDGRIEEGCLILQSLEQEAVFLLPENVTPELIVKLYQRFKDAHSGKPLASL